VISISGVKIRTPIVSPTQQVHQLNRSVEDVMTPVIRRTEIPTVELARQLTGPPRERNLRMSRSMSSEFGNPTYRRIRLSPTTDWSAAPAPIPKATARDVMMIVAVAEESNEVPTFHAERSDQDPGPYPPTEQERPS